MKKMSLFPLFVALVPLLTGWQCAFSQITTPAPSFVSIESAGDTKLVKDSSSDLYAQVGINTPSAIRFNGEKTKPDSFEGWQPLAVETVAGVNKMLWLNVVGHYLSLWILDENWNWQYSLGDWGLTSPQALTQETDFQMDFNGDGIIGKNGDLTYTHWTYTLNASNEATLTGYYGPGGDVLVPATLEGYSVKALGRGYWAGVLPITNVAISDGVTIIGDFAFDGLATLNNVSIPEGVTNIGYCAFRWSGITSAILPDSLIRVGEHAFSWCANLTNASLGSGLSYIDGPWSGFIFGGCQKLTNISVNPANTTYSSVEGVLFDKAQTTIYRFPEARTGSYSVPSGVTTIAAGAFVTAHGLTQISFPESLTTIKDWSLGYTGLMCVSLPPSVSTVNASAFVMCTNLMSVTIQGSLTSIGTGTFDGCTNLTSLIFLDDAPLTVSLPIFPDTSSATVFHLSNKSGWSNSFAGRPTALIDCLFTEQQFRDGASGYTSGRAQGRSDVTTNPSAFNLFTQSQFNNNRAAGQSDVINNPTSYGLYTSNSIMDLRMGGLMIQREGTNAVVSFQPQTTTDLTLPFTNNGTPIIHTIPMPGNKGFLRINAKPEQSAP